MQIVIAEALNNISEHAYAGHVGRIEMLLRRRDGGFQFTLIDQGIGMPGGIPPPGVIGALPDSICSLPEGGFGWLLIRSQTQDLTYLREKGGNRLSFVLPMNMAARCN
jgi:serine/threonine-protein kinase RsbW